MTNLIQKAKNGSICKNSNSINMSADNLIKTSNKTEKNITL